MKCAACGHENREGSAFCETCGKGLTLVCSSCRAELHSSARFCHSCGRPTDQAESLSHQLAPAFAPSTSPIPTSFASGRYEVKRFLSAGGKRKVHLAHDTTVDRDVAFALIKTEGMGDVGRTRIQREAQAMARLGDHPHIVTVFDIGQEGDQPYMVTELSGGGDVEPLVEKAENQRVPLDQAIRIAIETCLGLEFAHDNGIVHRDLKPGNVWLTSEGVAKIGDFGLAVATDRSRLTQEGMMVGTVSYLPPEQAMGGTVDGSRDLYSLGAMLYEMVSGRPPFVGDDSVAIMGQHLNPAPLAPTWHNPECPKALESIDLTVGAIHESPLQTTVDNPIYNRTFVGRESEMCQLESAFDNALSGVGSLSMVVGETEIGKTALIEQLATYVLDRDPQGLERNLGTGAADVARIVSEIRDRVQVELHPSGDPEDDRYRLLQAVTNFLRNASAVKPLCIVLEDLHWSDRGTLDLFDAHCSPAGSGGCTSRKA